MATESGSAPQADEVARWRYLVPNIFTAASAGLGIAACFLALEGELYWGCWCVLWCVLLDKADGTAARLLKSTSAFGMQFDSMADLLSFGLAPAVLFYTAGRQFWSISVGQAEWWLLALGCGLFALMAAVRLARFNAVDTEQPSRLFSGVPSTLCGAMVPAALLVAMKYEVPLEVARFGPVAMGLLGLGMVSQIPIPKVVRRKSKLLDIFQWANVVGVYTCGILTALPEYILALTLLYLSVGSIWGLAKLSGARDGA